MKVGLGLVVLLTLVGLACFASLRSNRALEDYFEHGKAFAARQLELVTNLSPELAESSGLAVSRAQPGVYWTHNDSGDGPNLYAFDDSGRVLARFQVAGAEARDWEEMSSGPCVGDLRQTCLYLADIGDNNRVRQSLTVYVVGEPMVSAATRTLASRSFRYRYPQGADDAEALAVLPDGDVVVVSKGRSGTISFFRLRRDAIARSTASGEVLTAEYAGASGIEPDGRIGRHVTGAAVSPDATTLAVRTYYEVYFFQAVQEGGVVSWRGPGAPCFLGDVESQGEAIAYLDADRLLLTSERGRGTTAVMHRLRC
jgi:hypothetical protein